MKVQKLDLPGFDAFKDAIDFQQLSVLIFGRLHPQPRLVCWYGPTEYTYSGLLLPPRDPPTLIQGVMDRVNAMGYAFNSCMCNLYRGGVDSVSWHSDDEPIFGIDPAIASVSIGAARRFLMRRKDRGGKRLVFELGQGDLIVMPPATQRLWEHSIPKTKREVGPRINLTLRRVDFEQQ